MRTLSAKKVVGVLRTLGFRPARRGNGTGHAVWRDAEGRAVHPVLRHGDDLPIAQVFSLGSELEARGVISRMDFTAMVRAA